ncbi:NDP-sugar synthase [Thermoproteota archaeon]
MMKAIILAGGFGKRLRPLTDKLPKALIEVSGVPILLWQLNWLKRNNITDIVILAGYFKEKIIDYVSNGSRFGLNIDFVFEKTPLGTGGALKNAKSYLEDNATFIMINGDILTNFNLKKLYSKVSGNVKASIAVIPLQSSFGIIDITNDDTIVGFREKPLLNNYWMNAGAYCLSKNIFDYLPDKGNIESTTFPELASKKVLKAVRYDNTFWTSIDSHKDIENAAFNLKDDLDYIAKIYKIKK